MSPCAHTIATHSYRKNHDSPLGKELNLQQGDTLSYILEHEDNEYWWLAELTAEDRWDTCQCRIS